jgi:hypothetical protein
MADFKGFSKTSALEILKVEIPKSCKIFSLALSLTVCSSAS